jgi:hypothetical protein
MESRTNKHQQAKGSTHTLVDWWGLKMKEE